MKKSLISKARDMSNIQRLCQLPKVIFFLPAYPYSSIKFAGFQVFMLSSNMHTFKYTGWFVYLHGCLHLIIGNMTLARIKKEAICEYGWTWWCRIIETCPQSQCWNLESENSPSILKFHDFHGQGIIMQNIVMNDLSKK